MSDGDAREPVSFLVFAASLRDGSLNAHLAELAAETLTRNAGSVDIGSMTAFDCPSYDADVQDDDGFPDPALEFQRRLEACDAFVISSPEYNASIPRVLKNAIDWVSRFRPQPFHGRNGLTFGVALDGRGQPGCLGASRSAGTSGGARVPRHVRACPSTPRLRWGRSDRR